MNNFDLTNYLSKNRLNEAIELTRLYPKNPDKVAQKVADHFTLYDDLDLIYSVQPGSLKMDSRGAYFDLDTKAGPNTPGEDWEDVNGFGIDNYLGDYAGGSFIIRSEEGLDEDFFVIRNLANRNEKVGMVTDEEEIIFSSSERKDFPGFEGTMDALDDLKIREATPGMDTDKMIKTYNIGKDSRLVFAGDNKTYYVKNIAPDRKSVFVTIDGSTTFKKPLSKITKVDGKMVEEIKSNKMTKKELKEMIRQNILNELAEEITEDSDMEFGDPDVGLAKMYGDFYEGLEEANEFETRKPSRIAKFLKALDFLIYDEYHAELYDSDEVKQAYDLLVKAAKKLGNLNEAEDQEEKYVGDDEKFEFEKGKKAGEEEAATAEPTLTDTEKEIQGHLDQALQAAQEMGNEKLIQQIGNTITFFTRDFVVKEDVEQSDVESAITGKKLDLKKLEDATKKAMSGDSTDLTMFLAGVFEGKKEYYRDAEADDAEHIDALEKDMEDDKKSSMNESMFPLFKKIIK